ncbi:MAG: metallopeptidase TldD-related protein [Gammaproteobacteria bacterium]|nr:metallopeptidase TldD-related protein [Gammaproteobacteria bacterium]
MDRGAIEQLFDQLAGGLIDALRSDEHLSLSLRGESSHFCRFNAARIRQTGLVEDSSLDLELIIGQRRASSAISLSGNADLDMQYALAELNRLRAEIPQLLEDPYIVLPASGQASRSISHGQLLDPATSTQHLLPPIQGIDLAGIWASGRIYRGHANSLGSRHWFETDRFALDYSLVSPQEKMVKATYAGSDWNQAEYEASIAASVNRLRLLDKPTITIKPGQYRTFIAAAGVADLLSMFSWHGLSELSLRTGESAFLRMREGGETLSALFSLAEDFSHGQVPRFNDIGEVAPQRLELIRAGQLENSLVSSRTAREYGLESNFAAEHEALRSPRMAPGELDEADVLNSLGEGVYLSNLHYLNWSDSSNGRITGMTRYACFWVADGEIQGPIANMRFDDSFYHFFGDNLQAVSSSLQLIPDVETYGSRGLGLTECPGILLESFALTL